MDDPGSHQSPVTPVLEYAPLETKESQKEGIISFVIGIALWPIFCAITAAFEDQGWLGLGLNTLISATALWISIIAYRLPRMKRAWAAFGLFINTSWLIFILFVWVLRVASDGF